MKDNFRLNDLLTKSNRTEIQTYKVQERTFGTPGILMLCFYLKLILRISRFRIIVTHQDKAEDKNKKLAGRTQLQNCP